MRWIELLEGDNQRLSMRSICTYIVVFTLCGAILMEVTETSPSEGIVLGLAGILSTLMGIIYGVGKVMDASVTKAAMPSQAPISVENVEQVTVNPIKKGKK